MLSSCSSVVVQCTSYEYYRCLLNSTHAPTTSPGNKFQEVQVILRNLIYSLFLIKFSGMLEVDDVDDVYGVWIILWCAISTKRLVCMYVR